MFNSFITPSRLAFLGAAMTLSSAGSAFSAIIASDNFSYAAGAYSADAWNGGTGWQNGSSWISTNATNPTVTSQGQLGINVPASHEGVRRTLGTSLDTTTSGTIWGSVDISFTENSANNSSYGYISLLSGTSEVGFRFGRGNSSNYWRVESLGPGGSNADSDVLAKPNPTSATVLFKIEYDGTNSIASFYLDPTATTEAGLGVADATLTRAGGFTFDGIRLQAQSTGTFDNLILGNTFVDVIPEPSSAMLGLLGSSLLLIRKRRAE